jgi:hypothetical protein
MFALRETCDAFAATLRGGPDVCPDGLFRGTRDRALLGLKVHANTISHARLIALEESFPHTRDAMGEGAFNAASRLWLDAGHGGDRPLALIGADFPGWLAAHAETRAFAPLARFEWFWLEAYHAAEAVPFGPAAMQAIAPDGLLAMVVAPHPSARIMPCDEPIAALCGFPAIPDHVFVARPDAEVKVHPATATMARLFALFDGFATFQDVLETFWAEWPNEDAVAGINGLVSIGAFTLENASC